MTHHGRAGHFVEISTILSGSAKRKPDREPVIKEIQVRSSRRKFFFLLFAIVALFQVASIFFAHIGGDELVYPTLSKNMGWDFPNYTVMEDAPLNQFSNQLYRQPVFMHPPLFSFILKVGSSLVNPVLFGIIFNGLLKFALAVVMWHFALALGAGRTAAQFAAVFVTA